MRALSGGSARSCGDVLHLINGRKNLRVEHRDVDADDATIPPSLPNHRVAAFGSTRGAFV
jgi:hypothetical protein